MPIVICIDSSDDTIPSETSEMLLGPVHPSPTPQVQDGPSVDFFSTVPGAAVATNWWT